MPHAGGSKAAARTKPVEGGKELRAQTEQIMVETIACAESVEEALFPKFGVP